MTSSNLMNSGELSNAGPTVERINAPDGPGARITPDFRAFHELGVRHELALWGTADRAATLEEDIAFWRGNEYEERHVYVARLEERIVGCGTLTLPLSENTTTAGVHVLVDAPFCRRGFGSVILGVLEGVAKDRGRSSFDGYCGEPIAPVLAGVPLLEAASGSGGVPRDSASTRFAVHCGYSLEQVETNSSLALPFDGTHIDALEADARSRSTAYSVITWSDRCPAEFVEAYARLKSLMSTEVPIAGLGWEGEAWDAARVRQEEATLAYGRFGRIGFRGPAQRLRGTGCLYRAGSSGGHAGGDFPGGHPGGPGPSGTPFGNAGESCQPAQSSAGLACRYVRHDMECQ
ncbi:GNAT family N-acetyltransferase [Paenarthrobacter ureafaciens]